MNEEEQVSLLYRAGRLRFKVLDHRLDHWDRFREWNARRQTRAGRAESIALGASYDRVFVDRSSRKTAKTGTWMIAAVQECIEHFARTGAGSRGMIAIPVQKKIGGVLVPIAEEVFRDAPVGYKPIYRGTHGAEHECLIIPAVDGIIKLVGLDTHPDALRGPYLDWLIVTEAGYVRGLEKALKSEIFPQMHGRRHAWVALESSEPKQKSHDFSRVFRVDAELRGAYTSMVITENTRLTPEEIEDEIRASGGRDSAECKRELFNETDADPETMIIPEFDESVHVVDPRDWPMPTHACAISCLDPGTSDPFGIVCFYFDFMRQVIVVQAAWQKSNASTGEVQAKLKEFERELWGTSHRPRDDFDSPELRIIDPRLISGAGQVWEAPANALTYWDKDSRSLLANPYSRISDISNRLILDLNVDYGLNVRAALKGDGSAEADIQHLRMLFADRHENGIPKIVILRNGLTEPLIQQCRDGMWSIRDEVHRRDWLRSKILGHCDALAAAKYGVRDVPWNRNPFPPPIETIDRNLPNTFRPESSVDGNTVGTYNMYGDRVWR